jgi:N-acetylglucosamine malate deacetylase 1
MTHKRTKLDILAIAAHPDDVELSCSATLAAEIAKGKTVGILDLTRGELGTRGTPDLRQLEARKAADILGIQVRDNAGFSDGFFKKNNRHKVAIMRYIRYYQPDILLLNAPQDRHPDHARAAQMGIEAAFLSGLHKIQTQDWEGKPQEAWRPKHVYHYIQSNFLVPDFIVDVSDFWELKMKAIRAFESQFDNPNYKGEGSNLQTFISDPNFLLFIEARGKELGQAIGKKYGEGFIKTQALGLKHLSDLT